MKVNLNTSINAFVFGLLYEHRIWQSFDLIWTYYSVTFCSTVGKIPDLDQKPTRLYKCVNSWRWKKIDVGIIFQTLSGVGYKA